MTQLATLESLQDAIHAGNGSWGVAAREAAEVPSFGGDATGSRTLAQGWEDAATALASVQHALAVIEGGDGAWAGEAHTAAVEVIRALAGEVGRAAIAVRAAGTALRTYGEGLETATARDRIGQKELRSDAGDGVDLRVSAHIAARNNAEDLAVELHDLAGQASSHRLPLSALDGVLLSDTLPVAPAVAPRVVVMASGARELIMTASSALQRAYLLKALAAGYDVAAVAEFAQKIAPHDDAWLNQHLDPLAWGQGPFPTCVAASTVTARASVDPIYALSITTTPGRLRAEQKRVYDGGRSWVQDALGLDGMTPGQSEQVANEEIAPRTGRRYEERPFTGDMLADIERAVDDGYPVPFITAGHQLVVIGHSGDQLRIYNPWGSTYWIGEQEFADSAPLVGFPA